MIVRIKGKKVCHDICNITRNDDKNYLITSCGRVLTKPHLLTEVEEVTCVWCNFKLAAVKEVMPT